MLHEARVALEYWRASGDRTAERLDSLVEHVCGTLGDRSIVGIAKEDARKNVRSWELETK